MLLQTELEGALTKKPICVQFKEPDTEGIFFSFADKSRFQVHTQNILSANRNTVLGNENNSLCFVEHLLAAVNLLGINKLEILVHGSEIPLADGSAAIWLDLLKDWPHKETIEPSLELKENLCVSDNSGRAIFAYPAEDFKLTYLFESPINKAKTWTTWNLNAGIEVLAKARTFASEEEHQLLGLKGKMLSYNSDGFDLPLYSEDEPALHKLLDLFGDLSLTGINPLKIKAHFVSLKGGHALNTQMAKALQKIF